MYSYISVRLWNEDWMMVVWFGGFGTLRVPDRERRGEQETVDERDGNRIGDESRIGTKNPSGEGFRW